VPETNGARCRKGLRGANLDGVLHTIKQIAVLPAAVKETLLPNGKINLLRRLCPGDGQQVGVPVGAVTCLIGAAALVAVASSHQESEP